jgi:hypothetical protein
MGLQLNYELRMARQVKLREIERQVSPMKDAA